MRIRERLNALAPTSLSAQRTAMPVREALSGVAMNGATANEGPPADDPPTDLPREIVERMLHSIHTSQSRLLHTTEVIAMIASAVAHADAILRRRPMGLPTSAASPPSPSLAELYSSAVEAANMRGGDGTYLLVGDHAAAAPFSPSGAFRGAATLTALIIVPGPPPGLAVAASALTASAPFVAGVQPVDILPLLERVARGNPSHRTPELHEGLARGASQLAHLQSRLALALSVLADAASLAEERPVADVEQAPSAALLAQTFGAIESARSLAERTLAIFPVVT